MQSGGGSGNLDVNNEKATKASAESFVVMVIRRVGALWFNANRHDMSRVGIIPVVIQRMAVPKGKG